MKRIAMALLVVASTLPTFAQRVVTIKGSDTMVIMNARLAEAYMARKGGQIQVTGGGSGVGIAALINGTTEIAASSRPIRTSEIDKLKARFATRGVAVPIARDGLAVYLHTSNPVQELSLSQLREIYTGKFTQWPRMQTESGTAVPLMRKESDSPGSRRMRRARGSRRAWRR